MSNSIYAGPNPKNINPSFDEHTYEYIVCLINGEHKQKIEKGYLIKLGWSKEQYLSTFPEAPTMCNKSRERYKKGWSDERRKNQSKILTDLNRSESFHKNQKEGYERFKQSEEYNIMCKLLSEKTKIQHRDTNLEDKIRDYFQTRYRGSDDQKQRSIRLKKNNPMDNSESRKKMKKSLIKYAESNKNIKHKKYKDTKITYQSSYELDFLDYCFSNGLTENDISNGKVFKDDDIWYIGDFILFDKYSVEIKSWYIEQLQESNKPGSLKAKQALVDDSKYVWLYIKDKNYTELDKLI